MNNIETNNTEPTAQARARALSCAQTVRSLVEYNLKRARDLDAEGHKYKASIAIIESRKLIALHRDYLKKWCR